MIKNKAYVDEKERRIDDHIELFQKAKEKGFFECVIELWVYWLNIFFSKTGGIRSFDCANKLNRYSVGINSIL